MCLQHKIVILEFLNCYSGCQNSTKRVSMTKNCVILIGLCGKYCCVCCMLLSNSAEITLSLYLLNRCRLRLKLLYKEINAARVMILLYNRYTLPKQRNELQVGKFNLKPYFNQKSPPK